MAKAVALPVGVVVSVLLALCWRLGQAENRQAAWRQLSQALGLFLLVALPWIITLSVKYDKPTFSTSGAIAHAIERLLATPNTTPFLPDNRPMTPRASVNPPPRCKSGVRWAQLALCMEGALT